MEIYKYKQRRKVKVDIIEDIIIIAVAEFMLYLINCMLTLPPMVDWCITLIEITVIAFATVRLITNLYKLIFKLK